jgi:hypothetical protein
MGHRFDPIHCLRVSLVPMISILCPNIEISCPLVSGIVIMKNYFISFGLGGWKYCVPSLRPIVVGIRHFLLPNFLRRPPGSSAIVPVACIAYIHGEIFAITLLLLLMP